MQIDVTVRVGLHEDFHALFRYEQLLLAGARETDSLFKLLERLFERQIAAFEFLNHSLQLFHRRFEVKLRGIVCHVPVLPWINCECESVKQRAFSADAGFMANRPRAFRLLSCLLWSALGVAFYTSMTADGLRAGTEDVDCQYESPLLYRHFEEPLMVSDPRPLGEWRLPLSAYRPEIITEARVLSQLKQNQATGKWTAEFLISFPDPKPYGIPFSFRKIELKWRGSEGSQTFLLDWSDQCNNPGRSLFPGQRWAFSIPVGEALESLEIRLWGSRN